MIKMIECSCGFCTEDRIEIGITEIDNNGNYICPLCGEIATISEFEE